MVLKQEVEKPLKIVPSRFFLIVKKSDDGAEVYKARFVLGGHRDRDKRTFVHNCTTLKAHSTRLPVAVATILDFVIWSTDINQAYLQSAVELKREVFTKPDILELNQDELIQIIKPLYGLADSGDYWNETLTKHHLQHLRMKQTEGDFSLFFYHIGQKLAGLSGTYVDDILRAGNKEFNDYSTKITHSAFDAKNPMYNEFTFTGLQLSGTKEQRQISQKNYIYLL